FVFSAAVPATAQVLEKPPQKANLTIDPYTAFESGFRVSYAGGAPAQSLNITMPVHCTPGTTTPCAPSPGVNFVVIQALIPALTTLAGLTLVPLNQAAFNGAP